MNTISIIEKLNCLGVSVTLNGNGDRLSLQSEKQPDQEALNLIDQLRENKSEVIKLLSKDHNDNGLIPDREYVLNEIIYTAKFQSGKWYLVKVRDGDLGKHVSSYEITDRGLVYSETFYSDQNTCHLLKGPLNVSYKISDFSLYKPISKSELWYFDIEVFSNFFSALFLSCAGDKREFIIYNLIDDREELREFINRDITLVGFNNLHYDNVILNAILLFADQSDLNIHLFDISKRIIEGDNDPYVKKLKYLKVPYKSIDLMSIGFSSKSTRKSLKAIAISLQWPKIEDLPISPDRRIAENEVDRVIAYNWNDVYITQELYNQMKDDIALRESINRDFDIDVINRSDSMMGEDILKKLLFDKSKMRKFSEKTFRSRIDIADCIDQRISFQSQELSNLLTDLKSVSLEKSKNYAYTRSINFAGLRLELGIGGLHSKDKPAKFRSDNQVSLIDCDVFSFYPNIALINPDIVKPDHLPKEFIEIYRSLVNERIEAKSNGDKLKAQSLKITINAVFGKFNCIYSFLYDPKSLISITVNGQLYLLSLIEKLYLSGIDVISANTDGVICLVKNLEKHIYYNVCREWVEATGFKLGYTFYDTYIRKDVNNYLAIKLDGSQKKKGMFDSDIYLQKGYKPPIIARAIANYFRGISIEATFDQSNSIHDFVLTQKVSSKFTMVLCKDDQEIALQKTNRYIASTEGGYLFKKNEEKRIAILKGQSITIVNDIESINPKDHNIDYDYYRKEIMKVIRKIDNE